MTVLVTYASKHGSTRGIAEGIVERLRERGKEVELEPIADVTDLKDAEAVVLGSAVYMGSWMKEATAFVERNRDALARVPVWIFSSGPTGEAPADVGVSEKQRARLEALLSPKDHHVFPGAIDPGKLGFLEKRIVKTVKAPTGDYRDWEDVSGFADRIADALT